MNARRVWLSIMLVLAGVLGPAVPASGAAPTAGSRGSLTHASVLSTRLLTGDQVHGFNFMRGRPLQVKVTAAQVAQCQVLGDAGQTEAVVDLNRPIFNPGGGQTADDLIELLVQTSGPRQAAATLGRLGGFISRCTHDPVNGGLVGAKLLRVVRSAGSHVTGADMATQFAASADLRAQLTDGVSTARVVPTLLAWRVGSRLVVFFVNHQTYVGRHETDGDAPGIHADAVKLAAPAVHDARG